jgi:hypothetical protein
MKSSRQSLLAAALVGWSLLLARSAMAEEAGTAETAIRLRASASEFLGSLSAEQRKQAVFPVNDPERRDWSNLPQTFHPRKGINFGELTPEQRMAQLFMVAAYSNKGKEHQDEITRLIKNQQIGGLIFMQGGPLREAKLTNAYQKISNVPLMISIDGEWGLSMRLDSTQSFPKQMT